MRVAIVYIWVLVHLLVNPEDIGSASSAAVKSYTRKRNTTTSRQRTIETLETNDIEMSKFKTQNVFAPLGRKFWDYSENEGGNGLRKRNILPDGSGEYI